jgi:hypothetical protein
MIDIWVVSGNAPMTLDAAGCPGVDPSRTCSGDAAEAAATPTSSPTATAVTTKLRTNARTITAPSLDSSTNLLVR